MDEAAEDMKELAKYLKNIKSFERQYISSERTTIGFIWGIFIIMAGLIDGYIASFSSINYSPHAPVWFLAIAGAMICQQIISSQPLLYNKEFTEDVERQRVPMWEIALTTVIMLSTIIVGEINVGLVMPYIGFAFGTVNLVVHIRNHKMVKLESSSQFIPFYFTGILLLILYFTAEELIKFFGLIFGIIVGVTVLVNSYQRRRLIEIE